MHELQLADICQVEHASVGPGGGEGAGPCVGPTYQSPKLLPWTGDKHGNMADVRMCCKEGGRIHGVVHSMRCPRGISRIAEKPLNRQRRGEDVERGFKA